MASLLERLLRHSLIYGAALIVTRLAALVLLPVYSRALVPEDFGVYTLQLSIMSIGVAIGSSGLATAVVRFSATHPNETPATYARTAFMWHIACATALILVLLPGGDAVSLALFGRPSAETGLGWTALATAAGILALAPNAFLRATSRPRAFAVSRVVHVGVLAGGAIWVLESGRGLPALLLTEAVAAFAGLGTSAFAARRLFTGAVLRRVLSALLRYGLPLVPAALALISIQAADRFVLNAYGWKRELGLYALAYRFAFPLYVVVSALQTAWPTILYPAGDSRHAPRLLSGIYTLTATLLVGLGLGLLGFAPPLCGLLVTPEYWDGLRVLPILIPAYVLHGAQAVVGNALHRRGKTALLAGIAIGAAGVNVLLNLLWIPSHGMDGAAAATLAAYVLLFGVTGAVAHAVDPVRIEWRRLVLVTGVGLLVGAGVWASRRSPGDPGGWLAPSVGIVLYVICLLSIKVIDGSDCRRFWQQITGGHV